jgi:DNA-binding response OmpR family regulator
VKILLIEADKNLREKICSYFIKKDISFDVEANYINIMDDFDYINLFNYDAFIFELSHENQKGIDLLDYLNMLHLKKPVLFISEDNSEKLLSTAFAMGAEDYLPKPFELKELELRLTKALRYKVPRDEISLSQDYIFTYSDQAVTHNQLVLNVTRKQKALLYLFTTHKNHLVTYEMISDFVYEGKPFTHNAIASHIRDLKKKVEGIHIKAVKGEGYIFSYEEVSLKEKFLHE